MSPERVQYPRSEKARNLINFLRDEEERMAAEERTDPLSYQELSDLSGYPIKSVSRILRKAGISREDRRDSKEKDCAIPSPSQDLSYFIGLLAASGNFSDRKTDFSLNRVSEENKGILPVFKSLGETLFQINATVASKEKVVQSYRYKDESVVFNSTKAFQFLGNLGKSRWPQTILEKHSWIFTNQDYIWGLLKGYFDGSGGIYEGQGNRVVLRSSSRNDCLSLLQLLVTVGIKEPKLQTLSRAKEGVSGVVLCVIEDARTFAQNVHSRIPKKEEGLEYYRTRQNRQGLKRISDDELINEYAKVRKILDHPPSYLEMLKLHKEGITRFNMSTYSERFGDESFVKAREYLEGILLKKAAGKDINELLRSYEYATGIQIRYVPKVHHDWQKEETAKQRLEELLSKIEPGI